MHSYQTVECTASICNFSAVVLVLFVFLSNSISLHNLVPHPREQRTFCYLQLALLLLCAVSRLAATAQLASLLPESGHCCCYKIGDVVAPTKWLGWVLRRRM